ncbi:MAG: heme exporter protein CcmB [Saprospiraceae bacterium]|jgi:heme exporter protein B|nr:heme exporter protein CcmB [Saprospiraceae bacterium]
MNLFSQILYLLHKEITLEWRQRYAISGILLYVLSTVFIVYISFQNIGPQVWNVLFWIIMLFASVNAVMKSFVQESGYRQLYYFQLLHPIAIILSKMIYNALLLLVLGVLTFTSLAFIAGNPVQHAAEFALVLFLGSTGFSITFTFVSAIAAKADNSSTLMAVLSFPVVIPVLLLLVNLSAHSIGLLGGTEMGDKIMLLAAVDMILVALGLVLFPFLWRD